MMEQRGRKCSRSLSRGLAAQAAAEDADMEDADATTTKSSKKQRARSAHSRARSHSRPREPSAMGLKDSKTMEKVEKLAKKEGQVNWSRSHASGEGDHRKSVHLVKWMNTGKKRMGTHYCR